MASLQKILDLQPKVIYPAHGPVVNDPINKVKEYIAHRMYREEQIIHTLKEMKKPMTAMELVDKIYVVSLFTNLQEYPVTTLCLVSNR